jgi:hypothetical protein
VALRAQYRTSTTVIDCTVEDMSRSGMFLVADTADVPGNEGQIEIDVPGDGRVQIQGKVVRVAQRGNRHGMGIRVSKHGDAGRPLANFMMRWSFWNRR